MEQLPKIVRHRMRAASASTPHPDPDLLTAFAEQSLTEREKSQVLDHLAQCAECREVMKVAAAPAAEPVTVSFADQAVFSDAKSSLPMPHASMRLEDLEKASWKMPASRRWWSWHTLRWGALAACVVAVGAMFIVPASKRSAPNFSVFKEQGLPQPANAAPAAAGEELYEARPGFQHGPPREDSTVVSRSRALGKRDLIVHKGLDSDEQARLSAEERTARTTPSSPPAARSGNEFALAPFERVGPVASAPPAAPPAPVLDKLEAAQASRAKTSAAAGAVGGTSEIAAGQPQRAEAPVAQTEKTPASTADLKSSEAKKDATTAELADARVFKQSEVAIAESVAAVEGNVHMVQKRQWPRCTVGDNGTLQSSYDAGKTWKRVSVGEEGIIFRAVSTYGPDVWAGGVKGALFHSADAGQRWTRVKPMAGGTLLTDDIVLVEFADMQRGKLITAGRETWTTADGGRTWARQ